MAGRIGTATRAVGRVLGRILAYLLLWLGLTCLIVALGIRHYWGPITFDQLRTNLFSVQTDGGGGAIVWKGILGVGVLPVVVTLAVAGIIAWRRRVVRRRMADAAQLALAPQHPRHALGSGPGHRRNERLRQHRRHPRLPARRQLPVHPGRLLRGPDRHLRRRQAQPRGHLPGIRGADPGR